MVFKMFLLKESAKVSNINIDIYKKQVKQSKRIAMLTYQGQWQAMWFLIYYKLFCQWNQRPLHARRVTTTIIPMWSFKAWLY